MLEQIYSRDLVNVKVSGVLGISGVSIVTRRNHRIEDRLEQLKRLFVSGDEAASLDHRVALIVDASFDAMTDVNSQLGSFVLELFVNAGISTHCFGKDVAKNGKMSIDKCNLLMLREVRQFFRQIRCKKSGAFLLAVVFFVATSKLNPLLIVKNKPGQNINNKLKIFDKY